MNKYEKTNTFSLKVQVFFSLRFYLFIFRERGRERERESERNMDWLTLTHAPVLGTWPHNPGMCPDQESNW